MQYDSTVSGHSHTDFSRKRSSESPDEPQSSRYKRARVDPVRDATSNGQAHDPNTDRHTPMTTRAASSSALGLPPLSLSILNVEPLDEFIKDVADFVHHMIMTRPDIAGKVEVEAKIGIVKARSTDERLGLPIRVESILDPNFTDIRFESNMPPAHHKHYNEMLNKLIVDSQAPSWRGSPLVYTHTHTVDTFYPSNEPGDREKVRVSRDVKTKEVVECVRKLRLGDLNVYSPKWVADWRVSVNLETPVPHPDGNPSHSRTKDRRSYSHEECTIDLTEVTTSGIHHQEVSYELEVEITRSSLLLAAAAKRGDPNAPPHERDAFDELIRVFVNNVRILIRNGGD